LGFHVDWLCRGSELLGGKTSVTWGMVVAEGRASCEVSFYEYVAPSSVEGHALGRVFGVVHAAGVTLVEYPAARLRVSGHKALLGAVY